MILGTLEEYCSITDVVVASDGGEATEIVRSEMVRQSPPKLILLDLKLPKRSGHEVLQTIRSLDYLANVPVVILTSSRQTGDLERAYALGANSYLCKPLEFDDFVKVVRQVGLYWIELNEQPLT